MITENIRTCDKAMNKIGARISREQHCTIEESDRNKEWFLGFRWAIF